MASFMRYTSAVVVVVLAFSAIVCMGAENDVGNENEVKSNVEKEQKKTDGVPVLVVKAGENGSQDLFWAWLEYDQTGILKPIFKPLKDITSSTTGQISQQVFSLVPMSQQIFSQIDSVGNSLSGALNPQQLPFIGQLLNGSGGSGGLGSLLQGFGGRR